MYAMNPVSPILRLFFFFFFLQKENYSPFFTYFVIPEQYWETWSKSVQMSQAMYLKSNELLKK